jgi:hypothetical protein
MKLHGAAQARDSAVVNGEPLNLGHGPLGTWRLLPKSAIPAEPVGQVKMNPPGTAQEPTRKAKKGEELVARPLVKFHNPPSV